MNKKILAPAVVFGFVFSASPVAAQSIDQGFKKRFYIGIGAGQSNLDPDTDAVPGLSISDDSDTAGLVTVGFDFSRRLTAELQYADLGTAELSSGGGVDYTSTALTGLYYLWNGFTSSDFLDFDGLDRRAGLSLYGRLGVGYSEYDTRGSVQLERTSDTQLVAGLGIEYSLVGGFGVRAEYISFDSDATYTGLGVHYRFGRGPQGNAKASPSAVTNADENLPILPPPNPIATLPPPPPLPSLELPPVPATVVTDGDNDGVSDALDDCPQTAAGVPTDASGCVMFNGVLPGVNFVAGSDTLPEASRVVLDDVVSTLRDFPNLRVSVQAHTDSQGDEDANLGLSRNRAIAVVRYLVSQGLPVERFEARAFGESRPIADNNTREGRLLNRRVEFFVLPKS